MKDNLPKMKSSREVCGAEITTAFFSAGGAPCSLQPHSFKINRARYFIVIASEFRTNVGENIRIAREGILFFHDKRARLFLVIGSKRRGTTGIAQDRDRRAGEQETVKKKNTKKAGAFPCNRKNHYIRPVTDKEQRTG
jgi:hypothetical protein